MLVALILAAATPAVKPVCQDALPRRIDARKATRPRKLGEEPAAQPIYAVLRTEDGCTRPLPVARRR